MRRSRLTGNFLVCASLACCGTAAELYLPETIPAPGNNMVLLRLLETGRSAPLSEAERRSMLELATTSDHRFIAALRRIEQAGANRFFLYEFLVWPVANPQEVYQARYSVHSTGTFEDFNKEVPFTITATSDKSEGAMTLPVHPVNPAPSCNVVNAPSDTAPLPVALTGTTTYTVTLECGPVGFLPRITEIRDPEVLHPSRWRSVRWKSRYFGAAQSAEIRSRRFDLMTLSLEPQTLAAIGARFLRFAGRNAADDRISVDLAYAMRPAGLDVPLKLDLPVTFVPSLGVIAGFLGSGLLIGWFGAVLLGGLTGPAFEPRRALSSLVLGLIVAVFALVAGILAYGLNCRLQVFGFDVNPFDMIVQLLTGAFSGVLCFFYADQLKTLLDAFLKKIKGAAGAAALLCVFGLFGARAGFGADPGLDLVGLAACPDGQVIGLGRTGAIVRFGGLRGGPRPAGKLRAEYNPTEIACASIQGRTAALVAVSVLKRVLLVAVDVGTGRWWEFGSGQGASAGIAYDAQTRSAFFSSSSDQNIYHLELLSKTAAASPELWAPRSLQPAVPFVTIYGHSVSLGPVAVDDRRRRLIVSDAFSGVLHSVDLQSRKQAQLSEGFGVINSLAVDAPRDLLYVADSGRRTVWVLSLTAPAPKPAPFLRDVAFQGLTGVAVDPQGQVWVSVITTREIRVYDRSRNLLRSFR